MSGLVYRVYCFHIFRANILSSSCSKACDTLRLLLLLSLFVVTEASYTCAARRWNPITLHLWRTDENNKNLRRESPVSHPQTEERKVAFDPVLLWKWGLHRGSNFLQHFATNSENLKQTENLILSNLYWQTSRQGVHLTYLFSFKNNISVGGGVIAFLGKLPPSNVFITSLRFAPSTTRSGAVQIDPLPSSCAARLKKKGFLLPSVSRHQSPSGLDPDRFHRPYFSSPDIQWIGIEKEAVENMSLPERSGNFNFLRVWKWVTCRHLDENRSIIKAFHVLFWKSCASTRSPHYLMGFSFFRWTEKATGHLQLEPGTSAKSAGSWGSQRSRERPRRSLETMASSTVRSFFFRADNLSSSTGSKFGGFHGQIPADDGCFTGASFLLLVSPVFLIDLCQPLYNIFAWNGTLEFYSYGCGLLLGGIGNKANFVLKK